MAALDRYLAPLQSHGATGVRLREGDPVHIELGGAWQAVTRSPLGAGTVRQLLAEVMTFRERAVLDGGQDARFSYQSPGGPVEVVVAREDEATTATIRPAALARPDSGAMDALLRRLPEAGASDLHLRSGQPPILRVDGDLRREAGEALSAEGVAALLRSIMPAEVATQHREEHDADWAYELEDAGRFRCNAGVDRLGPFGVFRLIPAAIQSVEELGVSPAVQQLCGLTKGLVLVTGPTGSGKSTTLASLIDLVNRTRTEHILTIEDPIEFVHPSKQCLITQRQVGPHTGSFTRALRAALREDPDVVLVGEMRDLETIAIALETAETGHLVFGTLHTTTAASTLDRIIDQFPADRQSQIRVMLSESLRGVVSQVLCRKVGGGRVAAREVLLTVPAVSNLIREGKTFQIPSIMQTNRRVGMATLNDSLLDLVEAGTITAKEAWLKWADKTSLLQALGAKGHDTAFAGSS